MTSVFARVGSPTKTFLDWWIGELTAVVPGFLRRASELGTNAVVLEFSNDEIVVSRRSRGKRREIGRVPASDADGPAQRKALSPELRKLHSRGGTVSLRLAAHQALRKILDLPMAAEENLRQVLAFEMDRHTPFKPEDVYFDFRVVDRDPREQRIRVKLTVAQRHLVDHAVDTAARLGLRPDRVEVAGDTEGDTEGGSEGGTEESAPPVNLLADERDATAPKPGSKLTVVLVLLAAALAIAAVYTALDRRAAAAAALLQDVAAAKADAEAARSLRSEIDRLVAQRRFVVDEKRRRPATMDILNRLTRLLPDDTWVSQFELKGGELQVSGYSAAASKLIALIERSPMFRKANFRSPVTQDRRVGLERFQLSAEIVGMEPR